MLAAGQHFVGADAAASGERAAAFGIVEAGKIPAVGVIVGAGVHPLESGFVLIRLAVAVARPLAIGIGIGDGIADVKDDAGPAVKMGGDLLHGGGVVPRLRQRLFRGLAFRYCEEKQ